MIELEYSVLCTGWPRSEYENENEDTMFAEHLLERTR